MNDNRFNGRTVCKRIVTFHVGTARYTGAIQNMSNYGASIQTQTPDHVEKGTTIRIAMSCDDQKDIREARVVWSEAGAFGAKFL
jgi:PilZ domain-containing protein